MVVPARHRVAAGPREDAEVTPLGDDARYAVSRDAPHDRVDVTLTAGGVRCVVAHREGRRFSVLADGVRITDRGTRFEVALVADDVRVRLALRDGRALWDAAAEDPTNPQERSPRDEDHRQAGAVQRPRALQHFGLALGVAHHQRDEVIRQFREDPDRPVLLLSYGTGAVGLNLQFSNYVFLFDRWWNPAVEDQAINRAHRVGQKLPVSVTRFLCENTIERRISEVLDAKRKLFNELLEQNGPPPVLGLTEDEIFGLFNIQRCKKHNHEPATIPFPGVVSDDNLRAA